MIEMEGSAIVVESGNGTLNVASVVLCIQPRNFDIGRCDGNKFGDEGHHMVVQNLV
jgi:hypothetical protein